MFVRERHTRSRRRALDRAFLLALAALGLLDVREIGGDMPGETAGRRALRMIRDRHLDGQSAEREEVLKSYDERALQKTSRILGHRVARLRSLPRRTRRLRDGRT